MLCLSGFELYSRWVPLMFAAGDVFKMLVFYSVLARQYAQYGNVLCMWIFFRSQYVSTLSTAVFYVGISFGLRTLVRLVRPCSIDVGILFGLSTLSTAMFSACWYFIRSFWYFIRSQYAKYGQLFHFYRHACMAFFSFTTEHSM